MNKKLGFFGKVYKYRDYLIMLLPAVLFFLIFSYLPMAGIVLAFKKYNYQLGIFGSPWVGFENFKYLFISGNLQSVIRNTLGYNIGFILINNFLEILFAIILVEIGNKYFKKLAQSFMFLPYFISWVVAGAIVYNLLNYDYGAINGILASLGFDRVDIYSNPLYWIPIILVSAAWKGVGYGTVIYLAAIMGIDTEMYEAAEIDGANIFKRIQHITIPSLKPTIIILILLSLGNIFRGDFNMFYQLTQGNPLLLSTTDVIDTFVTRSLLNSNEVGMAASAGLFQSIFGFFTIMIFNFAAKKYDKEYALF